MLDALKTRFGVDSLNALPALLFGEEGLMRLGGFQAPQVRQGARTKGPICPEPLANNIVKLNVRHREAWFNGVIRALAQVRAFAATITGSVDATDLEPTAQYEGCGQVTRTRKMADKRGNVHEMEVAV